MSNLSSSSDLIQKISELLDTIDRQIREGKTSEEFVYSITHKEETME